MDSVGIFVRFYDHIMLWAVNNGMTGVNMQRRGGFGGGLEWDEPAKDVGIVVSGVRQNIRQYKGNPDRIFLWSSSAGNGPVSTYAAHMSLVFSPNTADTSVTAPILKWMKSVK